MELRFKVAARIARPVHEVYEAVADPAQLSAYFATGGAGGRLETGRTVSWEFHDFPGAFPVEVIEAVPDARIVLRWPASEGDAPDAEGSETEPSDHRTEVTITFTGIDGGRRTLVEIAEGGWRETQGGLQASYGNCQGWSEMLCSLKAWLEHGIRLRQDMYK